MKIIIVLLISIVSIPLNSCKAQNIKTAEQKQTTKTDLEGDTKQATKKNMVISYVTSSKAKQEAFILDKKILMIKTLSSNKNDKYRMITLTTKDVKEVEEIIKNIDINNLPNIEVPSKKHQYDGASSAYVSFSEGKKEIAISPTFDAGNPPKEIAILVEKLISFKE